MEILRVENFRKKFNQTEVLKGINFTLQEGQILVIIGSSGSGKTTLLRCLNYLETPDEGKVYLNGALLSDAAEVYSDAALREKRLKFGLVFQNFNLFPHYRAEKNVSLAADREGAGKGVLPPAEGGAERGRSPFVFFPRAQSKSGGERLLPLSVGAEQDQGGRTSGARGAGREEGKLPV